MFGYKTQQFWNEEKEKSGYLNSSSSLPNVYSVLSTGNSGLSTGYYTLNRAHPGYFSSDGLRLVPGYTSSDEPSWIEESDGSAPSPGYYTSARPRPTSGYYSCVGIISSTPGSAPLLPQLNLEFIQFNPPQKNSLKSRQSKKTNSNHSSDYKI